MVLKKRGHSETEKKNENEKGAIPQRQGHEISSDWAAHEGNSFSRPIRVIVVTVVYVFIV